MPLSGDEYKQVQEFTEKHRNELLELRKYSIASGLPWRSLLKQFITDHNASYDFEHVNRAIVVNLDMTERRAWRWESKANTAKSLDKRQAFLDFAEQIRNGVDVPDADADKKKKKRIKTTVESTPVKTVPNAAERRRAYNAREREKYRELFAPPPKQKPVVFKEATYGCDYALDALIKKCDRDFAKGVRVATKTMAEWLDEHWDKLWALRPVPNGELRYIVEHKECKEDVGKVFREISRRTRLILGITETDDTWS